MMAVEPVRVGIIGLGRSGWNIHALGIETHPAFRVAAVVDAVADRRREATERFGCAAYEEYRGLIADPQVELVVVATPSHTHASITGAALAAKKHVLVEKPMAMNVAEADAMLAAARSNGRLLTVYQIRRLDPDFLKVQEILKSGVLGPVHLIKMGRYSYQRRKDWQTLRKFGGGQLNNWGAHIVDQALILAGGDWERLFADLRHTVSAGDADDHVKIAFKGKNGATLDIEVTNACAQNPPEWVIMGKYGALSGSTRKLEWKYYDAKALPELVAEEGPAPGRAYGARETIPWVNEAAEITPGDGRRLFYDRLYASIREGAPLFVTPESVRKLIELFDACRAQSGM